MQTKARDTIVALSSPASGGSAAHAGDVPRAIIRLSGPRAFELLKHVFELSTTKKFKAHTGWRRERGFVAWRGRKLGACAYCMPHPRSYTREDVAELHFPGLRWVVSALLDNLIAAGARLAQPGEFTRRALENGRIGIEQAEAVGALIASTTADEARAHAARLHDHSRRKGSTLKEELEELLSLVELGLDFSHEDVGVLSPAEILKRLQALEQRAQEILNATAPRPEDTGGSRLIHAQLPRIVLAGPTNAGKSSLFNRLLETDAAIVSPQRHTTRDFVEAPLSLNVGTGAVTGLLVDTAGSGADVRAAPGDPQEWLKHAAWNATVSAVRSADVLLLTLDGSVDDHADLQAVREAMAQARPASAALIWTKADLRGGRPAGRQKCLPHLLEGVPQFAENGAVFEVSALSGAGIAELRAFLAGRVGELASRTREAHATAAAAASAAASRALEALTRARDGLQAGHGEDIVAVELREAVHAFWQAEGVLLRHDAVTESMLDRIFSRFCIGK